MCSWSSQFEQENEQIFAEMNTLVDEVRQIEGKVIEISKLQEIFADKILVQVCYIVLEFFLMHTNSVLRCC